ncbi:hypothetical protein ACFYUY_21865 [Kitasatospora sp. NPDC004745]|uniref:hypothetical protein n=1 Tax=unclassified Kitasatospora TaxID=2633591 RepID=UPI0033C99F6B
MTSSPPHQASAARSADLAQALRSGPFDLALRTAIRDSGLSLEGIQRRLTRRGLQVSVSSLSYWQRGRSRPERPDSLAAVRVLEDVLGLHRDELVVLLGPRRPRGRWVDHIPGSLDYARTFGDQAVEGVLAGLDPRTNARVESLHTRVDVHIGAHREERRVDVLQVVRALATGADRLILLTQAKPEMSAGADLGLSGLVACRLGRRRIDRELGVAAAELLFDLPLQPGQTTVVEYSYAYPSTEVATHYQRMVRFPGRGLVLRACFDPAALPAGCTAAWRPHHDAPPQAVEEVPVSPAGHACAAFPDVSPGIYGLTWEWNDQPGEAI